MERSAAFRALACLVLSLAFLLAPAAADPPPDCKGKACVDYGGVLSDEDPKLPLEKAARKKVDKRRDKEKAAGKKHKKPMHPLCAAALDLDPAECDEKCEEDIAKHCDKSPGRKKEVLKNQYIRTPDGKKRGKKVKTRTTLSFEKPGQRYGHEK
jgi:hypothetical protein